MQIEGERRMKEKVVLLALLWIMLASSVSVAFAAHYPKNIHSIIVGTIDEPQSVDPAWAYDTASAELIFNVYEPLIFFPVDRSLPREEQGIVPELLKDWIPKLATDWSVSPDGKTYIFKMRGGVKWHDGTVSTAAQMAAHAEWTFERWMIFDRTGGPTWMIQEPCLGVTSSELTAAYAEAVDDAVEDFTNATGSYLQFNLIMSYAPFPTIIAQSWAGIINRDWAAAHGCFPGFSVTGYDPAVWGAWNDPTVSPFDDYPTGTGGKVMMGTGPYKFDYWTSAVAWSILKFDAYYGGWPANLPGMGGAHPDYPGSGYPEGWIERATVKFVREWATRKMMFLAGDLDFCYVPRARILELMEPFWLWGRPEEYLPGIDCDRIFHYSQPMLALDCMFFNFDIATDSPYLGPGFDPAYPYAFGEDKIPVNFFDDLNVRQGFSSAFNYNCSVSSYISVVYLGEEATRPAGPVKEGERYYNPAQQQKYYYNMPAAAANLTIAHGGQVWANGFTMTVLYNTGNEARRVAAEMIEAAIESLNPKFHVVVEEMSWPLYLKYLIDRRLPMFISGWLADYPDPHNNVWAFMHSQGYFAKHQGYYNPTVDDLVELGIRTPDGPQRQAIYYQLQQLYVQDCPSVPLAQPFGRHWERDWVMGWYYNPIYGGSHAVGVDSTAPNGPGLYFYHYYKGWSGDTDKDYDVDLTDLFNVLIGYGMTLADAIATYGVPPCTDTEGQWERSQNKADNMIDLDDLYSVLMQYG